VNGMNKLAESLVKNAKRIADLKADRDELHATLSGLCSFLGAGTPDAMTTAAEMNRMIHAGIKRREEAARDEARKLLEARP